MDNAIKEHVEFIGKLIDIGEKQLSAPIDEPRELTIVERRIFDANFTTKKLYVENFWRRVSFLAEKMATERDEVCCYYFPLTRTLTEIYAELVYLLEQDYDKQCGICVAQHLFTLSKQYRYPESGPKNNSLKELYEDYYEDHEADKLGLPHSIEAFSKKCLEKSEFAFPKIEDIIKNHLGLQSLAPITKELYPALTNELIYYSNYRIQSNFLHGNIYAELKTEDKPENERYWVIAQTEILGFLFVELVDKKILSGETETELRQSIEEFKRIFSGLVDSWSKRRE